jgi:anti-sigma factor RsiW
MGSPRCNWVRDRLPLLVGDDLQGPDRRRVERHLIGCPQCRQHHVTLGQTLGILRTAATIPPVPTDVSSLWPALARQIRESRRPVQITPFALPSPFVLALSWFRIHPWPVLGLGLGLLATIGVGLGVRQQHTAAQTQLVANEQPIAPSLTLSRPQLTQTPVLNPMPGREAPVAVESPTVENTPPRRDYDLDHGRPMPDPWEARDTKATY